MNTPDKVLEELLRTAEMRAADFRHSYKEARRFAEDEHRFWQEARAEVLRLRALLHSSKKIEA